MAFMDFSLPDWLKIIILSLNIRACESLVAQNNPQILIQNCIMGNMDKYFKCNTENPHCIHVLAWITIAAQSNYINYSISSTSVIKTRKFFY